MFQLPAGQVLATTYAKYEIVAPLGEGGRGQTYLARVIAVDAEATTNIPPPGTPVVVKIAKIDEERGIDAIRHFLNFVDNRLMEEARALTKLERLACVAHYIDTGTLSVRLWNGAEVLHPRFLVQEFIEGKTLLEARPQPCKTATDWFDFSASIVEALLAVHQCAVVHNDVWHKNIMLTADDKPVIIDFGEAVFRNARFLFIDQPARDDPWSPPEWAKMHLRPSRRADIYGVGGVLFWLACGVDPPMPDPDIEKAKVEIAELIHKYNETLLAENVAIADIIARCRRFDRALRIGNAEKLRRELLTFGREVPPARPKETADHVLTQARSLAHRGNVFLDRMADMLLRELERQLEDMHHGIVVISGKHEDLVTGCLDALASLKPGDEYLAISTLKFWKPENIGVRGRFLSMTQLCAQRGVKIRRLFLLTNVDSQDEHFWPIMRAQMELDNPQTAPCLETRFRFLPRDEFTKRMEQGDHCGYWISGDQVMNIVPLYDLADLLRSIHLIESYVTPARVRKDFDRDFGKAERLTLEALSRYVKPDRRRRKHGGQSGVTRS
jgi:serine/threonine protein kinase